MSKSKYCRGTLINTWSAKDCADTQVKIRLTNDKLITVRVGQIIGLLTKKPKDLDNYYAVDIAKSYTKELGYDVVRYEVSDEEYLNIKELTDYYAEKAGIEKKVSKNIDNKTPYTYETSTLSIYYGWKDLANE